MEIAPDILLIGLFFEASLLLLVILIASILFMKIIDFISIRLGNLIRYLAFPGLILHKVCHDVMCHITGVPVLGHHIFPTKKGEVGNRVRVDSQKVQNFTCSLLIGLAPLLILSVVLFLFLMFWNFLPLLGLLKLYFAFCFFIGLPPSRADLHLITSIAKEKPRQTLLEIGLLTLPLLASFGYLTTWSLWHTQFSMWMLVAIFLTTTLLAYFLWRIVKHHRNS